MNNKQEMCDDLQWDERKLGSDERYVVALSREETDEIMRSVGFETINLRLPKDVLDHVKRKASEKGVNMIYLIREALSSIE